MARHLKVLFCTSPVGLTSVNDMQWKQRHANSSATCKALAFPFCLAACMHKARVRSPAQKCNCLCIITRKPAFAQHFGEQSWLRLPSHCASRSICFLCTWAAPHHLSLMLSSVLNHLTDYQRIKPLHMHRYADNLASEILCLQFAQTLELAQRQASEHP